MRVMISGGGTGGHIYPALAIAEALKAAYPDSRILYAGNPDGMEHRLSAEAGYDFLPLSVAGLTDKNPLKVLKILAKNLLGLQEASRAIRAFKPHLVIGTGGYACGPLLLAASRLGVPTLLHEQNAVMGKTNRILSSRVNRLCLTFPITDLPKQAASRAVITGLPVRRAILAADKKHGRALLGLADDAPVLLITGGSQGARHLNQAISEIAPALLAKGVQIIHLCGDKLYQETASLLAQKGIKAAGSAGEEHPKAQNGYLLLPYLEHIEHAMAAADVVAARAGASFLAELAAIGRAAVLVPYPFAAGNHQARNAACFRDAGAAVVIEDAELSGDVLMAALQKPLFDIQLNRQMAEASKSLGHTNAAAKILAEAAALCRQQ